MLDISVFGFSMPFPIATPIVNHTMMVQWLKISSSKLAVINQIHSKSLEGFPLGKTGAAISQGKTSKNHGPNNHRYSFFPQL